MMWQRWIMGERRRLFAAPLVLDLQLGDPRVPVSKLFALFMNGSTLLLELLLELLNYLRSPLRPFCLRLATS
jgi:hypothetical protein